MPDASKERDFTAFHEAGHAVACWKFGIKVRSVTIAPCADDESDDSLGHVAIDESEGKAISRLIRRVKTGQVISAKARGRLEHEIICCLAGSVAEERRRGVANHEGACADYNTCRDIAMPLCGSLEEVEAYLAWLRCRAVNLIESKWWAVATVAEALLAQGTMSGEDVWQTISASASQ